MSFPMFLLLSLPLLLLSLCFSFSTLPILFASSFPCPIPRPPSTLLSLSSPSCHLPLLFNVTGTPDINGHVGYLPMLGSARVVSSDTHVNYYSTPLVVYNTGDDNIDYTTGCPYTPSDPTTFYPSLPYTDDGIPLSGLTLIFANGGCPISMKQQIAYNSGVGMILSYDSTGVNGKVEPVVEMVDLTNDWGMIPFLSLPNDDGAQLFQFILDQTSQFIPIQVNISFPPSGHIPPTLSSSFYNFSRLITVDPMMESQISMGSSISIVGWNHYVAMRNETYDICGNNVMFVWCEYGMVRYVGFIWENTMGIIDDEAFSTFVIQSAVSLLSNSPRYLHFPFLSYRGGFSYFITNPNVLLDSTMLPPAGSPSLRSNIGDTFPSSYCQYFYDHPAVSSYLSLYEMDLSYNVFSTLPICMEIFPYLSLVSMSNNVILSFPSTWQSASGTPYPQYFPSYSVTQLSLANNKITDTFPIFNGFSYLEVLDLSRNDIYGIVYSLCYLYSLVEINVAYNALSSLPDSSITGYCDQYSTYNPYLITMNVGFNKLSYLPASLSSSAIINFDAADNLLSGILPSLSNWSYLSQFLIPNNQYSGVFPCVVNGNINQIDISQNQFTSFCDTFDYFNVPSLTYLKFDNNQITQFPLSLPNSNIEYLLGNNNQMASSLPNNMDIWYSLYYFDVSFNHLNGSIPSFSSSVDIAYIDLSYNHFTSLSSPYVFDNLTLLWYLEVSHNMISSPLPTLKDSGCVTTTSITYDFSYNQFYGGIPEYNSDEEGPFLYTSGVWSMGYFNGCITATAAFVLNHNALNDTNSFTQWVTPFYTIDLSYNSFYILTNPPLLIPPPPPRSPWQTGSYFTITHPIAFADALIQNNENLYSLILSHNNIEGTLQMGYVPNWSMLNIGQWDMSYNLVSNVPTDIWKNAWNLVDFSHNNLTGYLDPLGIPQKYLASMDFTANPHFISPNNTLPSYLIVDYTSSLTLIPSQPYSCYSLHDPKIPGLSVSLDGTYYGLQGCECNSGYYGKANIGCQVIPLSPIELYPNVGVSSVVSNGIVPEYSFSDQWFDDKRQIPGVDSSWMIDGSKLYGGSNPNYLITNANNYITSTQYAQNTTYYSSLGYAPILSVTVYLHIDLSVFNSLTDIITLSAISTEAGGIGTTIAVLSGNSSEYVIYDQSRNFLPVTYPYTTDSTQFPPATLTPSYLSLYSSSYHNFTTLTSIAIPIYISNIISINFNSRSPMGQHFFSTYAMDNSIPNGYHLDAETGLLIANIPLYTPPTGLLDGLYALDGVISAIILVVIIVIFYFRNSAIIRASSRPFVFFILFSLLFMSITAVFFVLIPSNSATSTSLCRARVWSSSLSLICVLSVLFAKSLRIALIFDQKSFKVKSLPDSKVASIAAVLIVIQIVFLIVFTANNMTWGELVSCGDLCVTWSCNTGNGFNLWVGLDIAYFAIVMFIGAVIAFKTRSTPSSFNESVHIMFSLFILLIFLAILVPLDWLLISNSPSASIVIQAGGQMIIAISLLSFLYFPKLLMLLSNNPEAKSQMVTAGRSKKVAAYSGVSSPRDENNNTSAAPSGKGKGYTNSSGDGGNSSIMEGTSSPKNAISPANMKSPSSAKAKAKSKANANSNINLSEVPKSNANVSHFDAVESLVVDENEKELKMSPPISFRDTEDNNNQNTNKMVIRGENTPQVQTHSLASPSASAPSASVSPVGGGKGKLPAVQSRIDREIEMEGE